MNKKFVYQVGNNKKVPISKLQPTRCNVSLIYLFVQTLYMFQAVPPPIIRRHISVHTASGIVKPILLLAAIVEEMEQGRSAVRRIMSMKNSNYTIGNRTRDLPAYPDLYVYQHLAEFILRIRPDSGI